MIVAAAHQAVTAVGFPEVDYSLVSTESGSRIAPPLPSPCDWGERYKKRYMLMKTEAEWLCAHRAAKDVFVPWAESGIASGMSTKDMRKGLLALQKAASMGRFDADL